jgi:hypothetical protein
VGADYASLFGTSNPLWLDVLAYPLRAVFTATSNAAAVLLAMESMPSRCVTPVVVDPRGARRYRTPRASPVSPGRPPRGNDRHTRDADQYRVKASDGKWRRVGDRATSFSAATFLLSLVATLVASYSDFLYIHNVSR